VYYLQSDRSIPHALNAVWGVAAGSTGFFLLAAALYSASLPLSSHYPKIARNLEMGFWIAILGGLIPIARVILWRSSRRVSEDEPINRGWPAAAVPIPLLALAFATAAFPAELGRALGAGLIVYLAGSVFFATVGATRRLLGELHRRNIGPVWVRNASACLTAAVAAWFVVGLSISDHEVRHGSTGDAVIERLRAHSVSVDEAVDHWWQENRGPDGRATMLLIATAGGRIRAAYWTSAVLSKLDQIAGFRKHLFAISSVSGGSLGAGLFRAAIAAQSKQIGPCSKDDEFQCFKSFLFQRFFRAVVGRLPV
jgi:hypothetical protein